MDDAAHTNDAAARAKVFFDALAPENAATCGEIGTRDELHELIYGDGRIINEGANAVHNFPEIMGGNIGGHADGNTRGAIHEEVWKSRRNNGGLCGALLVIGGEIHGILIDIAKEFFGELGETALSVTVSSRRVAVHRTEVTLWVNEGVTHDPVLAHANEGIIDRQVTVRVVILEDFADNARALIEGAVVEKSLAEHGVEDTALNGLQAITGIGESTADDNRHRVIDVSGLHDIRDVLRDKLFVFRIHGKIALKKSGKQWNTETTAGAG